MKKWIKALQFLAIILLMIPPDALACRLFAIVADEGDVLNQDYSIPSVNSSRVHSYEEQLQSLGSAYPDGWALLAYQDQQLVAETGTHHLRGNGNADDSGQQEAQFDDAQLFIKGTDNISIIMGHLRLQNSGCGTGAQEERPVDPHPFVWTTGGITYTFAHNGGISDKAGLRDLIDESWIDIQGGFLTATCMVNGEPQTDFDYVVDSEVYFFWIMKNILNSNRDVSRGIQSALANIDFQTLLSGDDDLNFTFSDGESVWAYKKGDNAHLLYWIDDDSEYPGTGYYLHYKAVASDPGDTNGWTQLTDDQLVYLPRVGDAQVISNISSLAMLETKPLVQGWNWEGFPVLADTNGTLVDLVMAPLDPFGATVQGQYENSEFFIGQNDWYPDIDINSAKGYKVEMSAEDTHYNLLAFGERVSPNTPVSLNQGENWVSYFIPESQAPLDALPSAVVNRLIGVKAQTWYMLKKGTKWIYSSCQPAQGPCRTFDYGEMYILKLSAGPSLQMIWETGTGGPPGGGETRSAGSFELSELSDYTALEILSIEDPGSATEVGVFLGDACVGSGVVTDFPLYLQVYNGDQDMADLSFQVLREGGLAKSGGNNPGHSQAPTIAEHYRLQNIEREVTTGGFVYYSATIEKSPEPMITTTGLVSCYPNPFNPSTTLRYDLAHQSRVSVVIYNIQGRVVENLFSGIRDRGRYELEWDASLQPSGLYFVRFRTNDTEMTRKVLLMK